MTGGSSLTHRRRHVAKRRAVWAVRRCCSVALPTRFSCSARNRALSFLQMAVVLLTPPWCCWRAHAALCAQQRAVAAAHAPSETSGLRQAGDASESESEEREDEWRER